MGFHVEKKGEDISYITENPGFYSDASALT